MALDHAGATACYGTGNARSTLSGERVAVPTEAATATTIATATATATTTTIETALEWFHRSSRKRRRRSATTTRWGGSGSHNNNNNNNNEDALRREEESVSALRSNPTDPVSVSGSVSAADPSTAARMFLRLGRSGIAPIDAAWKRFGGNDPCDGLGLGLGFASGAPVPNPNPPPVLVLEGPKDVGKTWMLLTLAARFVVATRASRFRDAGVRSNRNQAAAEEEETPNGTEAATTATTATTNGEAPPIQGHGSSENNDTTTTTTTATSTTSTTTYNNNKNNNSANGQDCNRPPKVLLLDSTYDFSVSQLVNVVRSTLRREREKQSVPKRRNPTPPKQNTTDGDVTDGGHQRSGGHQKHDRRGPTNEGNKDDNDNDNDNNNNNDNDHNDNNNNDNDNDDDGNPEPTVTSLEEDMEDCLSRIHILQVDDPNGWVPVLEALTHRLSEERSHRNRNRNRTAGVGTDTETALSSGPPPPTLLLWDGFLSDVAATDPNSNSNSDPNGYANANANANALFDNPLSGEILRHVSRLLREERDTLWWVLTARAAAAHLPFPGDESSPSSSSSLSLSLSLAHHGSSYNEHGGIGFRLAEWIRKEEERREQQQQHQQQQHAGFGRQPRHRNPHQLLPRQRQRKRTTHRVRLDRRLHHHHHHHHDLRRSTSSRRSIGDEGRIPKTAAAAAALFARLLPPRGGRPGQGDALATTATTTRSTVGDNNDPTTIPYSISLGGILS